jgi:hypothetical protein
MTLAKRWWLRLWWMGKLFRAEKEPDPATMRKLMHAIPDSLEDKKEIFDSVNLIWPLLIFSFGPTSC